MKTPSSAQPNDARSSRGPLLLACILTVFLAACGQRGPLFLPQPGPSASPAGEEPAGAQDDERDEEQHAGDESGSGPTGSTS
jgi:predicted small lipoprotein YifL